MPAKQGSSLPHDSRRDFLLHASSALASAFLAGCGGFAIAPATTAPVGPVATTNPSLLTNTPTLYHFLVTGQSLAVGTQGTPALSKTQPFSNKMFTLPALPSFQSEPLDFNAVTLGYSGISLRPLQSGPSPDDSNAGGETIQNGFSDSLTSDVLSGNFGVNAYEQLISCSGVQGTAYAGLAGPTDYPPNGSPSFQEMMSQVATGMALAKAAGLAYVVPAMLLIHGEFDGFNNDYATNIATWQSDMQKGVNAITGRNDTIPLIAAQTQASIATFYNVPGYGTLANTAGPLGTLTAALNNPSRVFLACPEYMMAHHYYADASGNPDPTGQAIHMTADGYRHLGLMMAKAAMQVTVLGKPWQPLMPLAITLSKGTIKIEFSVPHGPIVIDTSWVSDPGNYGFAYYDSGQSTITSVTVTGPSEITIQLSTPSAGGFLSYAMYYPVEPGIPLGQGFGTQHGNRGCVRDSDPTVSYYNNSVTGAPYPLQNYAVMFQQQLTAS
jgi:hypothetical protein